MLTPSSFSVLCQRFYVATSRHLKRLDSVSRSPIYSHFSETVTGTSVVRAYGRSQDFKAISDAKADTNMRAPTPTLPPTGHKPLPSPPVPPRVPTRVSAGQTLEFWVLTLPLT